MTAKEEMLRFISEQPDNISTEELASVVKLYLKLIVGNGAFDSDDSDCILSDEMMTMFGRV